MATRRGQLISQMRSALNDLQKPYKYDETDCEESVIFDIADTSFEFTMESLDEEVGVL